MEPYKGIQKPSWMLYFDSAFYEYYLNNLRKENSSLAKVININELNNQDEQKKSSILKNSKYVNSVDNTYVLNELEKVPDVSELSRWRKRRTNGIVIIIILLIAAIATATTLIIHLLFIHGRDPFAMTDLPERSGIEDTETSTPSVLVSTVTNKKTTTTHATESISRNSYMTASYSVPYGSTDVPSTTSNRVLVNDSIAETTSISSITRDTATFSFTDDSSITDGINQKQGVSSQNTTVTHSTTYPTTQSTDEQTVIHSTFNPLIKTVTHSTTNPLTHSTTSDEENILSRKNSSDDVIMMQTSTVSTVYTSSKMLTSSTAESVIMTHTADVVESAMAGLVFEKITSTTEPHITTDKSLIIEAKQDVEDGSNFIVLDKAGTTLDVESGDVIAADQSKHRIKNTDIILTGGVTSTHLQTVIVQKPPATTDEPDEYCQQNPTHLIPDPHHCARYFNCSDPSAKPGLDRPYLSECQYPRLFKDIKVGCILFTKVKCGDKYEPKAPCEYNENRCSDGKDSTVLSCVGRRNGIFVISKTKESTTYIACYGERTVGQFTCKSGMVFDKKTKTCITSNSA